MNSDINQLVREKIQLEQRIRLARYEHRDATASDLEDELNRILQLIAEVES